MTSAPATDPAAPRRRVGQPLATATLALLTVLVTVGAVVVHRVTGRFWGDLAVYRTGASAAASGDGDLYRVVFHAADGTLLGFTYPPFAALLFGPLAYSSMDVAIGVWTLTSLLALLAVIRLTLRITDPAGSRRHAVPMLIATLGALPVFAVAGHLQVGQVGLILMLIVLIDLTGDPGRRWAGLGVGIAAGIKLTPLIFVVYLLVTGRPRAAATAVAGFLATVALGFAWRPRDSYWFWSGGLFDTDRVTGDPRTVLNQSVPGAVARVLDSATVPPAGWLPVAALVAVAGLGVAAWCVRSGDHLLGTLACAATGLLVSPVSWHHHWVWWVPALVLLTGRAWLARHRLGLAATGLLWLALVASGTWLLPVLQGWDLHFQGLALLYSNLYVLLGLVALALLPIHLRRVRRADASTERPGQAVEEHRQRTPEPERLPQ